MTEDARQRPKPSEGDVIHSVITGAVASAPIVGGPLAKLLDLFFAPPIERRKTAWIARIEERLAALETAGVDLRNLAQNEQFVSTLLYASHVALHTHQTEKLDALRNAVVNVAIGQAPEEALQHMFLNLIDTLTPLHLRVLKVFQAPALPPDIDRGDLAIVLEHNVAELKGKRALSDQIWKDLHMRGLVDLEQLTFWAKGLDLAHKRTTEMGDSFLRFIENPAE